MATLTNVSGQVSVSVSLAEVVSSGVVTTQSIPAAVLNTIQYANGTGANQCDLIHAKKYTLAASPTTIDLTALADLTGAAQNHARVREFLAWIDDTTLTHTVLVGDAAATAWVGFLGATHTLTVYPGGGVFRLTDPTSVGGGVGAVTGVSNKSLKLDPGAFTVVLNLVVLGCSAVS